MNVEIIRNEIIIKGLVKEDIPFCNISGADTGSIYYNPQKPEHSLRLCVKDPDIVEMLSGMGVNISEKLTADGQIESWSFKIKVYPRIGKNRITGQEEQLPKVMIKDPNIPSIRLDAEAFNLIDRAVYRGNIVDISLAFHVYEAKPYNRLTSALDELKLVVQSYDELISMVEVSSEMANGYLSDDSEEDVPF